MTTKIKPEPIYVAWAETGAEPVLLGVVPRDTPAGEVACQEPHWAVVRVSSLADYFQRTLTYHLERHFREFYR